MAALVRRARGVVGPDAIPSHSAAMVRLFAEINRSAAPMLGLVALGVCAVALAWIGAGALAIWSAFIVCAIALIYALPIAFLDGADRRRPPAPGGASSCSRPRFCGAAWAYLVVALLRSPEPNAQAFAILVMLLVSTVMSLLTAAIPAAFVAGMLPMIVGVVILYASRLQARPLPDGGAGDRRHRLFPGRRPAPACARPRATSRSRPRRIR